MQQAGQRLGRKFRDWVIVTAPLPEPITEALLDPERAAVGRLTATDWLRWFFDGWDQERNAEGSSESDW